MVELEVELAVEEGLGHMEKLDRRHPRLAEIAAEQRLILRICMLSDCDSFAPELESAGHLDGKGPQAGFGAL